MNSTSAVERRLVVGATLGMLLAAAGILRSSERPAVGPNAVARVDGRELSRADYERRLAAVAADRREPLDAREGRRVLERMIDEELLFGRALELDLPRRDPRARKELIGAVIDAVTANAGAAGPTDDELRAFYEENRAFFAAEPRLRVRSLWFRVKDPLAVPAAEARAARAREALAAGEAYATVAERFADVETATLPDTAVPFEKVIEYLGPSAARAAAALAPGATTEPIRTARGVRIVQLVEKSATPATTFDEVRPSVAEEWHRRRDEQALREALAELRANAKILRAEDANRDVE